MPKKIQTKIWEFASIGFVNQFFIQCTFAWWGTETADDEGLLWLADGCVCVICLVKAAWLAYKWRNYCTLAVADYDIQVQYKHRRDDLYSGLQTRTGRSWDLSPFTLLFEYCKCWFLKKIPIFCSESYKKIFRQSFCSQNQFFEVANLLPDPPCFLQQWHTDICCSVWGSSNDILSSNTRKDLPIRYLPYSNKNFTQEEKTV